MHERFELFYNQDAITRSTRIAPDTSEEEAHVPEFSQFNRFHGEHNVRPYRTEMRVYDSALRLAGSIDLIALKPSLDERSVETRYIIYDWKRSSKELSPDAPHYGRMCKTPLSHLPDTAYTHYVLQQNMYAHLLREQYDMRVDEMYLVRFHPTIDDYQLVPVPNWDAEVKLILDARLLNLQIVRKFRGVCFAVARMLSTYRGMVNKNRRKRVRDDDAVSRTVEEDDTLVVKFNVGVVPTPIKYATVTGHPSTAKSTTSTTVTRHPSTAKSTRSTTVPRHPGIARQKLKPVTDRNERTPAAPNKTQTAQNKSLISKEAIEGGRKKLKPATQKNNNTSQSSTGDLREQLVEGILRVGRNMRTDETDEDKDADSGDEW
ncbi:hypothetical protein CYMTET_44343 [Cymbomonas tetramitiformis]|uniref:PD-(D/E)XK endonuclease-like domain-containing protein n=1 Tax=Cymbomonas tetramitiformis TaxID=36881 RepID=A0AAE0C0F3_9CHLO|nr:hypothetical protein CYMTET_44343 [Cymbomonas tetramitiformis]